MAKDKIIIKGAREHNLKNIDISIPLKKFVCVSGISGSGKSTLVNDILAKSLLAKLHGAHTIPGAHTDITGIEHIERGYEDIVGKMKALGAKISISPVTT